jgi:hypothetical protein
MTHIIKTLQILESQAFIGLNFCTIRLKFLWGMSDIAISLATESPNWAATGNENAQTKYR